MLSQLLGALNLISIFLPVLLVESTEKPQTLFFSATLPDWVETTAKKYMTKDRHIVDVIGNEKQRAALTVEVRDVTDNVPCIGVVSVCDLDSIPALQYSVQLSGLISFLRASTLVSF